MRTILGVAIGASLTPAVVESLPTMAVSLALVPIYVVLIALIGVPFFRKIYRFDGATAWYAAMPGGLQDMILFGQEAGADTRALSLIHATRVMIIITLAPVILTQFFNASLDNPIGAPASTIPIQELVIMALAAIIGWKVAERIGMFGAAMLGPMILAGILSLTDVIHYRPPAEAILAAQFFIGITLGAGYIGVTLLELRRDVLAGVFFVVLLSLVTLAFTEVVILAGLAPPIDAFLAFAPAGQAEMTVLAIVVGADLGYVVVHHLTRVFIVITGAPIAARIFGVGSPPKPPGDGQD
jgi:membrane AbrB-like protein